ncbi:MAG: phosphotransferase, partial [Desulfocapsaceae bacterium]
MAQFTVLTSRDIGSILKRYTLGKPLSYGALDGGLANSSVKIETESGRYVLSVCDEKEMDEISRLCALLHYLEKHDFPTTRVIATREGEHCIDYQGKPLYIKRYIDGEVVRQLAAHQLFEVGATLAGLHELPPYPGLPERFSYGIECFDELKEMVSAESYYQWLSTCRKRVEDARTEALPRGFVHGDLFFDNMV